MYTLIGNKNIRDYQITIIFMGLFMLILLGIFYAFFNNGYYLLIILILIAFIISFSVMYSKLYKLEFDGKEFKISNLYSKKKENYSDFKSVTLISKLPVILCICFHNGGKYYFMLDTDNLTLLMESKEKIMQIVERQIHDIKDYPPVRRS